MILIPSAIFTHISENTNDFYLQMNRFYIAVLYDEAFFGIKCSNRRKVALSHVRSLNQYCWRKTRKRCKVKLFFSRPTLEMAEDRTTRTWQETLQGKSWPFPYHETNIFSARTQSNEQMTINKLYTFMWNQLKQLKKHNIS